MLFNVIESEERKKIVVSCDWERMKRKKMLFHVTKSEGRKKMLFHVTENEGNLENG